MTGDHAHITGWLAGGATARGASHYRSGLPNQDSIGWIQPTAGLMRGAMVVSDGHGGKPHDFSHLGSRLAVEAALSEFAPLIAEHEDSHAMFTAAKSKLPAQIHKRWQSRVTELTGSTDANTLLRFGATLVAVAAGEKELLLVQIGDGDILIGRADGKITRPLPDDQHLIGEQTHSLCEADAPLSARTTLIPIGSGTDKIDFIMLSTDGLAKSFADDTAFFDLARHYRQLISAKGLGAVTVGLGDWLRAASANGSGDDTSLGFFVAPSLLKPVSQPFENSKILQSHTSFRKAFALVLAGGILGAALLHLAGWRKPVAPEATTPPVQKVEPKKGVQPAPTSAAPGEKPKPAETPQPQAEPQADPQAAPQVVPQTKPQTETKP